MGGGGTAVITPGGKRRDGSYNTGKSRRKRKRYNTGKSRRRREAVYHRVGIGSCTVPGRCTLLLYPGCTMLPAVHGLVYTAVSGPTEVSVTMPWALS